MKTKKGTKHDQEKPMMDLLPPEALEAISRVLTKGAKKYKRANWAQGIEYSRLIAATLRHLNAFNKGEDLDLDKNCKKCKNNKCVKHTGESHIACAATNLCFLLWMIEHRSDLDNRWIKTLNI